MPFFKLPGWMRAVRPQDFVWVFLFGVLIARPLYGDAYEYVPLIALGIVQMPNRRFLR